MTWNLHDERDGMQILLVLLVIGAIFWAIFSIRGYFKRKAKGKCYYKEYMPLIACIFLIIMSVILIIVSVYNLKRHSYDEQLSYAIACIENEDYVTAYDQFMDLKDQGYEAFDSLDGWLEMCEPQALYENGIEHMSHGDWMSAYHYFNKIGIYNNADVLADYCYYMYCDETYPDWVPWMGISDIFDKAGVYSGN